MSVIMSNGTSVEVTYEGAVLRLREYNGYDDSDFHAEVWDETSQTIKEVMYATTRGWTYDNSAKIDATMDVLEKATQARGDQLFRNWTEDHSKRVEKGMTARTTVKGETFEGTVQWIGEERQYSAWAARYGTPKARYGIKVEGRAKLIFANADKVEVTVPPMSTEDAQEMRAKAMGRARSHYSQAWALAEAQQAAEDAAAQAADIEAEGLAQVESARTADKAHQVAQSVIDATATGYTRKGYNADGTEMTELTITTEEATLLVMNTLWSLADNEVYGNADNAGAVRIRFEDGRRVMLHPVRAEEPQEPQETPSAPQEAPEYCTGCSTDHNPAECGYAPGNGHGWEDDPRAVTIVG